MTAGDHTGSAAGFDYAAYLEAKRYVDDAALNPTCFETFTTGAKGAQRWLELGAGIGTMLARLLDRGAVHSGRYTMVDGDAGFIRRASAWLRHTLEAANYVVADANGPGGLGLRVVDRARGVDLEVELVEAEALGFLRSHDAAYDSVVAHTFVDLVDTGALLDRLVPVMTPSAPALFSGVYAASSRFDPPHDDDADLWTAYHRSMEPRGGPDHAEELRRELDAQRWSHAEGRGDWKVGGSAAGRALDGNEAVFMASILDTIEREPAVIRALGRARLARWLGARREQLRGGTLAFHAAQVDFVAHAPAHRDENT